jgi:hypothetical protein
MPLCICCSAEFTKITSWHVYCSRTCQAVSRNKRRDQRSWVSGNWRRYLNRLAVMSRERKDLTTQILLDVLAEQNGRCALTGVKMTNTVIKDKKTWTNASVDRVVSGGPYTKENIQLVCSAVNIFRSQMSVQEFREWCRLVARFRGLSRRT